MKEGPSGRPGGPFFMSDQRGSWIGMKKMILLAALLLAACDDRPPAPTAAENQQLNQAESMLNEEAWNEAAR
jgi:hypothetical protein